MIEFEVIGKPIGKQRPRVTRFGTYTPQKTINYEKVVKNAFKNKYSNFKPFTCELKVCITAVYEVPKSYSRKKHSELLGKGYIHKPDCDNIAKTILDSLNGIAYTDDCQVTELTIKKCYGECEKAIITIKNVSKSKQN